MTDQGESPGHTSAPGCLVAVLGVAGSAALIVPDIVVPGTRQWYLVATANIGPIIEKS